MATAKFSPTMPRLSRTASSCRSVRLRATGVMAWTLEWLATSGWSVVFATSQKPFSVMCARSISTPSRLHSATSAYSGVGQARAGVRRHRKGEGHAVREDVVAAPHRPQRPQAGCIEDLQRRKVGVDRLAALHMQHRSEYSVRRQRLAMSPELRQIFQPPARSIRSAIAAMSRAMSSDGARSSGCGQRRHIVPILVGLVERQIGPK